MISVLLFIYKPTWFNTDLCTPRYTCDEAADAAIPLEQPQAKDKWEGDVTVIHGQISAGSGVFLAIQDPNLAGVPLIFAEGIAQYTQTVSR